MSYAVAAPRTGQRSTFARPQRAVAVARPAGVRLTRRGRFTIFVTVITALLLAGVVLGAQSQATNQPGQPVATRTVIVQPGDTMWAIAADVSGGSRTQEAVLEIQQLNALASVSLSAGQQIEVPVG